MLKTYYFINNTKGGIRFSVIGEEIAEAKTLAKTLFPTDDITLEVVCKLKDNFIEKIRKKQLTTLRKHGIIKSRKGKERYIK